MSHPAAIRFVETDLEALATRPGRIALLADAPGTLSPAARRLDRATRGAVARALSSDAFGKLKPGEAMDMAFPTGLACEVLQLVRLPKRTDTASARKAGGAVGRSLGEKPVLLLAENHPRAAEVSFGLARL
jgi:leucyl aminopeptidase